MKTSILTSGFIIACLISFTLMSVSCSNDDNSNPIQSPDRVAVAVSMILPDQEEVQSRSYTDKDVKNLTVLVFDDAKKFIERIDIDAAELNTSDKYIKFNIFLKATADSRILHLIANARTDNAVLEDRIDFSGLNTNKTEDDIMPTLVTKTITTTGEDALMNGISPLIMWGRAELRKVSFSNSVDVQMLRSVACVRVEFFDKIKTRMDQVTKIAIHNGSGQGYVTSSDYYWDVRTSPTTGNPFACTAFDYAKTWSEMKKDGLYTYIYEQNCTPNSYVSVILFGKYMGVEGYYKIALIENDEPINILRNHRYTIKVLKVENRGYADVATAINSAPANNELMKVQIVVDETMPYSHVVADSQHWMGLSHTGIELIGSNTGTTTSNVELCTVYSSRGLAPTVKNIPNGLTTTVTGSGNVYKVIGTFSNDAQLDWFLINLDCDNLTTTLHCVWSKSIASHSGVTSDDDSYVLDLSSVWRNWSVWIPHPATNSMVHLHPTASLPGALTANTGEGMVTRLSSHNFDHAYLHINKSKNRQDVVWSSIGDLQKIVIVQ